MQENDFTLLRMTEKEVEIVVMITFPGLTLAEHPGRKNCDVAVMREVN